MSSKAPDRSVKQDKQLPVKEVYFLTETFRRLQSPHWSMSDNLIFSRRWPVCLHRTTCCPMWPCQTGSRYHASDTTAELQDHPAGTTKSSESKTKWAPVQVCETDVRNVIYLVTDEFKLQRPSVTVRPIDWTYETHSRVYVLPCRRRSLQDENRCGSPGWVRLPTSPCSSSH